MKKRTIRAGAPARRAWQRCHARSALLGGAAAAAFALTLLRTGDAYACGACLHQPNEVTVVTDHRMAFSISTQQTVLWDQIRYSGNPSEFAWGLPVRQGAPIELSHDEWIAALDATTQPQVVAPYQAPASSGEGCGGSNATADFAAGPGGRGNVEVIHQEVVGPYEAATIRSTSATALQDWLTAHGYEVSSTIEPIIAAYTKEGFDFIALRLRPGEGIRAMKPVRVVSPGADVSLPLRMIAGGVGESVALTLYVIGEGRYHPANFPDVTLNDEDLTWDTAQSRSNYQELSERLMASGDGRGWLTEFAGPPQPGSQTYVNGGYAPLLSDLYKASCKVDAGQSYPRFDANAGDDTSTGDDADADADAGADADSGTDADADANADASAPACTTACCDFDDLDVAFAGLHRASIWITRLRANLPRSALSTDLRLEATSAQTVVSNIHYAKAQQVDAGGGGCATAPGDRGTWLTLGGAILGLAALLRRRR